MMRKEKALLKWKMGRKVHVLFDDLVKLSCLVNGIMVVEPKSNDLIRLVKEIGRMPKVEGKGFFLLVA